jgi:hypothetical protein
MPVELKLTPLALKYLKDKHSIDLVKGANVDFEDIEVLAQIYVAGLQHTSTPPTVAFVMKQVEAMDIIEAVTSSSMLKKKEPGKNPVKKRTRTGG